MHPDDWKNTEVYVFVNGKKIKLKKADPKTESPPEKYVGKYFKDVSDNTYIYILNFEDSIGIDNEHPFEYYYFPINSVDDIAIVDIVNSVKNVDELELYINKKYTISQGCLEKLTEVSRNDVATGLCAKSFDDEISKECKEKVYSIDDISNACDKIIDRTDCYGTHIADAIGEICSEIIEELMDNREE